MANLRYAKRNRQSSKLATLRSNNGPVGHFPIELDDFPIKKHLYRFAGLSAGIVYIVTSDYRRVHIVNTLW